MEDSQGIVYKKKVVQFLGRSTPIILQNDDGHCPLLAICNVLLLRDSLNLSVDAPDVSLQNLLSIVADKLKDFNQQNVVDAISLLPQLATAINLNLQFKRINDFEFTRECAIFDLLDIRLYHGWLVDPQDNESALVIGSKSYNTLVEELVTLDVSNSALEDKVLLEKASVDFAAATTAVLGVPSPSLSGGWSFDDCSESIPCEQRSAGGGIEEAEHLLGTVNLSKTEMSNSLMSLTPVLISDASIVTKMDQSVPEASNSKPIISSDSVENVGIDMSMPNMEDKSVSQPEGYAIKNFLVCSASQLTSYNLLRLQEGPKERELCVFSRNNHFSTVFKFKGDLYLLADDQDYIDQPDLVWEKLNKVNGDAVYMTGNFTEYKIDNETSKSWRGQNARTSSDDSLATLGASCPATFFKEMGNEGREWEEGSECKT